MPKITKVPTIEDTCFDILLKNRNIINTSREKLFNCMFSSFITKYVSPFICIVFVFVKIFSILCWFNRQLYW